MNTYKQPRKNREGSTIRFDPACNDYITFPDNSYTTTARFTYGTNRRFRYDTTVQRLQGES